MRKFCWVFSLITSTFWVPAFIAPAFSQSLCSFDEAQKTLQNHPVENAFASGISYQAPRLKIIGEASNPAGDFLYCEYHWHFSGALNTPEVISVDSTVSNLSHADVWRVDYVSGGDKEPLLASKFLRYRSFDSHKIAPEVLQTDYRSGELRQSRFTRNAIGFAYQENTNKPLASKAINREPLPVIDAGFDNYVRVHWAELNTGKKIVFDFGSVPHLRVLPLRAKQESIDDCPKHSSGSVCLHVEANNPFVRFFVDRLELVYDSQKRLRLFKGAVNIQDENAKNQKAQIVYSYTDERD